MRRIDRQVEKEAKRRQCEGEAKRRQRGGRQSIADVEEIEVSLMQRKVKHHRRKEKHHHCEEGKASLMIWRPISATLLVRLGYRRRFITSIDVALSSLVFFFFFDQKLIRRVVKASVLIGIEIGLVWEYLQWSLATKCFRRYCPLLATNFNFVTKGARICYTFSDEF